MMLTIDNSNLQSGTQRWRDFPNSFGKVNYFVAQLAKIFLT